MASSIPIPTREQAVARYYDTHPAVHHAMLCGQVQFLVHAFRDDRSAQEFEMFNYWTLRDPLKVLNPIASQLLIAIFHPRHGKLLVWGFRSRFSLLGSAKACGQFPLKSLRIYRNSCQPEPSEPLYTGQLCNASFDWYTTPSKAEMSMYDLENALRARLDVYHRLLSKAPAPILTESMRFILYPQTDQELHADRWSLQQMLISVQRLLPPNERMLRNATSRAQGIVHALIECEMKIFFDRARGFGLQALDQFITDDPSIHGFKVADMPGSSLLAMLSEWDPLAAEWLHLPWESLPHVVGQRRGILFRGDVYVPRAAGRLVIAACKFRLRLEMHIWNPKAIEHAHAVCQSDPREQAICTRWIRKFIGTCETHGLIAKSQSALEIPAHNFEDIALLAKHPQSWMPPCMQHMALVDAELKNQARLFYGHFLVQAGASTAQIWKHWMPRFQRRFGPHQFVHEQAKIIYDINWNKKKKNRKSATCSRLMDLKEPLCPLLLMSSHPMTRGLEANKKCVAELHKRRMALGFKETPTPLVVFRPMDFAQLMRKHVD